MKSTVAGTVATEPTVSPVPVTPVEDPVTAVPVVGPLLAGTTVAAVAAVALRQVLYLLDQH